VLIASIEAVTTTWTSKDLVEALDAAGSVRAHRELRRGFQRRTPGRAGLLLGRPHP